MTTYFLPSVRAGFIDSLKPGALTSILIFLIFLYWMAQRRNSIILPGVIFLLGIGLTKMLIILGVFDFFLSSRSFDIFLDIGYFFILSCFIIISFLLLRDWWVIRWHHNKENLFVKFRFLQHVKNNLSSSKLSSAKFFSKEIFFRTGQDVGIFGCGMLAALLEEAWAPDSALMFMVYDAAQPGKYEQGLLHFVVYVLAFVFPLIVVLTFFNYALKSQPVCDFFTNTMPKLQIVFSALFLALGAALLLYYV